MSPRLQFANRATTTLDGNITDDAVSLTLTDSSLFPSAPFRVTIGSEIIEVGAINKTTHVASSLLRGQEDTDAAAHLNGAAVTNRWTKGAVEELADDADLTTHAALTTAHGAVSAATASKMVVRDASGRAAFAAPSAAGDAAILSTVTDHAALTAAGTHGSASAATASTLMHRDAAGRAKVVAPSAEDDIALKSNVTTVAGDLTTHAALTTAHGAVSAATASKMVVRDVSGRAAFADGAAAGDAVNKGQLDTKEATITAGTTAQYWRGDKSWQTLLGETSATAYRGDRGKTAYDYSQVGHVPLTRTVSTTTPLAGGGALSGNLTLTHSDAAGYKHIPAAGATGQFLKYLAAGTAQWADVPGGLELGETEGTAYRGDRGATAYTHSQAVTGAEHGAVSAATANMIVRRDASGRARFAAPDNASDAAIKSTVTDHSDNTTTAHGAVSANTASKLVVRDASARAQFADPSAAQDAATKNYVDSGATKTRTAVLTAAGAIPKTANGAAKTLVAGTNHEYYVCAFDSGTDEFVYFDFVVPADYQAGNVTVKVHWIAPAATSGSAVWNLATLGREAGEAWDAALGDTQTVTSATNGVAKYLNVASFTVFNPGWAAGDAVIIKISRDADNGSDTLAEDAHFLQAEIQYTGK